MSFFGHLHRVINLELYRHKPEICTNFLLLLFFFFFLMTRLNRAEPIDRTDGGQSAVSPRYILFFSWILWFSDKQIIVWNLFFCFLYFWWNFVFKIQFPSFLFFFQSSLKVRLYFQCLYSFFSFGTRWLCNFVNLPIKVLRLIKLDSVPIYSIIFRLWTTELWFEEFNFFNIKELRRRVYE